MFTLKPSKWEVPHNKGFVMRKNSKKSTSITTSFEDVKNKTPKNSTSTTTSFEDVKNKTPKNSKKSTSITTSFEDVKNKTPKNSTSTTTSFEDVKNKTPKSIKGKKFKGVERMYRNVSGIDIGSTLIHVAIVDENDIYEVREFGTMTPDLLEIAKWLTASNVQYAPMEATGVYWIPLFEILRDQGLTPVLIDPKQVKPVPGKKTDVLDCQWLHTLYSCGLVQPAFIPPKEAFRSYVRHRGNLIKARQRALLQMNKALLLMNIKLDVAVAEVGSITGINIIRAIVGGEQDPKKLAALRHYSCKKPEEVFIAALTGNFQKTHLFALKQSLETYDFFRKKIDECDEMILEELKTWETVSEDSPPLGKPIHPDYKRARKPDQNEFNFDMKALMYEKTGIDLTAINALGELTVATIISELGGVGGLNAFPSEKAFCSWLGLCPGNNVSGGKRHGGQSKKCKNRIKTSLCMAAMSLVNAKCSLGAYYRRMAARVSKSKAIKAVAHKLARLVYQLLKHGNAYVEIGQEKYEKRHEENRIKKLHKNANELGYVLVPKIAV
jgi:transposase